jgi:hypothetical protein
MTGGGFLLKAPTMRLIVRDERNQFNLQTRAYAECRAFSSLVGNEGPVGDVTVTLTRGPADSCDDDAMVICTIAAVAPGEVTEVQAVGRHAYAAIDRAVSLIRQTQRTPSGTPVRVRIAAPDCESV